MKFVVDENEIALLVEPLRLLFPEHEWFHVRELGLIDMDDVDVFYGLAKVNATALITRDVAQLRRTDEWRTLDTLGISLDRPFRAEGLGIEDGRPGNLQLHIRDAPRHRSNTSSV